MADRAGAGPRRAGAQRRAAQQCGSTPVLSEADAESALHSAMGVLNGVGDRMQSLESRRHSLEEQLKAVRGQVRPRTDVPEDPPRRSAAAAPGQGAAGLGGLEEVQALLSQMRQQMDQGGLQGLLAGEEQQEEGEAQEYMPEAGPDGEIFVSEELSDLLELLTALTPEQLSQRPTVLGLQSAVKEALRAQDGNIVASVLPQFTWDGRTFKVLTADVLRGLANEIRSVVIRLATGGEPEQQQQEEDQQQQQHAEPSTRTSTAPTTPMSQQQTRDRARPASGRGTPASTQGGLASGQVTPASRGLAGGAPLDTIREEAGRIGQEIARQHSAMQDQQQQLHSLLATLGAEAGAMSQQIRALETDVTQSVASERHTQHGIPPSEEEARHAVLNTEFAVREAAGRAAGGKQKWRGLTWVQRLELCNQQERKLAEDAAVQQPKGRRAPSAVRGAGDNPVMGAGQRRGQPPTLPPDFDIRQFLREHQEEQGCWQQFKKNWKRWLTISFIVGGFNMFMSYNRIMHLWRSFQDDSDHQTEL